MGEIRSAQAFLATKPGRECSQLSSRCADTSGGALRRGSAAARLLVLRVRIPPGAWMSVSYERCVFSGTGVCVGLITGPEESYRLRCV